MDEHLEPGDLRVGLGRQCAEPLLLEHIADVAYGLQLIEAQELKGVILQPLPIIIEQRVLIDHIEAIDLQLLVQPFVELVVGRRRAPLRGFFA